MAKGKKKPASTPKVKKAEPIIKDEAIEVKKAKAPKKEKKVVKAPKVAKATKHSFPTKEECKHTNTKRSLVRNARVVHVCTECNQVVRFGGR